MLKENLIGGRYSLRDPLGSGGMAEVFLAHDEVLERDVALKILKDQYADDKDLVKRFRREAQSAASLNHPRVVHIYDWGRSNDRGAYYIAMEYVPGDTLKNRILGDGPLPPRTAAEVATQIAEALQAAHGRGVVHRDVKPQNVLLTALREVKVVGFGIARAANAATTSRSSLVLGTASYMSPEQARGDHVGPWSDLYSLGVVLYEMLTGELPYEADSLAAVTMKHVTELPRSPREAYLEVPEEIDALTLKLLAKDPADRYGSATELVEDLRRVRYGLPPAFVNTESVTAAQPVLPAPPVRANPSGDRFHDGLYLVYRRRSRKLPWAPAATFVALLILLGAAAWGRQLGSQEQARPQDVTRGFLGGFGEAFEESKWAGSSEEEALDAGSLPQDEGQESSKADTGSLKYVWPHFASSEVILQNGAIDQNPKVGIPVESSTDVVHLTASSGPEQVGVPEVSEESTEETSQALSDSGYVVAGTATRISAEPAGMVIEAAPPVGSVVEQGTAASIRYSSGPRVRKVVTAAIIPFPHLRQEPPPAPTQPSKTKKQDQKLSR